MDRLGTKQKKNFKKFCWRFPWAIDGNSRHRFHSSIFWGWFRETAISKNKPVIDIHESKIYWRWNDENSQCHGKRRLKKNELKKIAGQWHFQNFHVLCKRTCYFHPLIDLTGSWADYHVLLHCVQESRSCLAFWSYMRVSRLMGGTYMCNDSTGFASYSRNFLAGEVEHEASLILWW